MGIQGLLPLLKDIQVSTSISNYKGQTVGIDAYCWLHKGAYGCAMDLALGKPTKGYIVYVMRRINMLVSHNITPILVFDGGPLPAKAETEKSRRTMKKKYRALAMAAMKEGNNKVAFENFQRCCEITCEMASEVIKECFAMNVQCIVAPYEADAQLAYLMKEGITQLTISEDSDLLLYGCNKVMYKMSIDGDGIVIDLEDLPNVKTVQLASFTLEKFRHMCMLSGCDYLPSIKGMGLMKAFKAIRRFSNAFQCIKSLKCNPSFNVPKDYEENFRKADMVFKYQLVFDIRTKRLVRLNSIDNLDKFGDAEKVFAGPKLCDANGIQIALGNIDPISGKTLGYLENFATGDISQKAQASGWDSPTPNTATSFVFRDKPKQSAVNNTTPSNAQAINKQKETTAVVDNIVPSPSIDKSLKRLLDEDVSVPTREEKIRKLYGEEVPQITPAPEIDEIEEPEQEEIETLVEDLLFSPTPPRKKHNVFGHNVFGKKTCTFKIKNSCRQTNNGQPQKIVTSKFFSNKIAKEKENNVLQVDTPSPEKDETNEESTETKPGSFIDYLDKTNVRGYEVNSPLVLSQSSPKRTAKQMKIGKIRSPKKSKRRNIFAVKSETVDELTTSHNDNNFDESVEPCSPTKPRGNNNSRNVNKIDFNITIPLDECVDKRLENPRAYKDNVKSKAPDILGHFQHRPKFSIYTEKPKQGVTDTITLDEDNQIQVGKQNPDDNMINRDDEDGDDKEKKISSKCNIKNKSANILSHFQYRPKFSINEKANKDDANVISLCEDKEIKTVQQHCNDELINLDDEDSEAEEKNQLESTSCDMVEQSLKNIQLDLLLDTKSDEKLNIDIDESTGVAKEERVKRWLDDAVGEDDLLFDRDEAEGTGKDKIIELDEEPLPFHLKQREKVQKKEIDKLNKYTVVESVDVIDLEEVIPSCSDDKEDLTLVKSLSFPSKGKSKCKPIGLGKCKPIGLSKKRKPSEHTGSDGKLKQISFEKFAFKRKSVC